VNDVLDLSKIEANQLELEQVEFNLKELIEQATEIYALNVDQKGIELACQVAPDVSESIRGDPARLQQILLNLIANAIKFTERGEIVVRVVSCAERPGALPPDALKSQALAPFLRISASWTSLLG
jgi:two-component system, sensor histidine kinase and response regulator